MTPRLVTLGLSLLIAIVIIGSYGLNGSTLICLITLAIFGTSIIGFFSASPIENGLLKNDWVSGKIFS